MHEYPTFVKHYFPTLGKCPPPMGEVQFRRGNAIEAILLDSHYKFERIDNMVSLLDVINKEHMASFLHDNATRTIVVCATHIIKDNPRMWTSLD